MGASIFSVLRRRDRGDNDDLFFGWFRGKQNSLFPLGK